MPDCFEPSNGTSGGRSRCLSTQTVPDSTRAAWHAFDAILETTLELGGTVTGEHGVGLLKRTWSGRELGDVSTRVHAAVKDALDPQHLLNPGKLLP